MATNTDISLGIMRIGLGVIAVGHAFDNYVGGFFAGGKVTGLAYFTALGLPSVFAHLLLLGMLVVSITLFIGAFARTAAAIFFLMVVSDFFRQALYRNFFMIWEMSIGTRNVEGMQLHLLAAGASLIILWKGAGALSIDDLVTNHIDWDFVTVVWFGQRA